MGDSSFLGVRIFEVKTGFLNRLFKETALILLSNRFFDSASCTEHRFQLMTIDLATLIVLRVLQIFDAMLNTCVSAENARYLFK